MVGALVHTKAINVTKYAEASRFLGDQAKTSFASGEVLQVLQGKYNGRRNQTNLRVSWSWLGATKERVLAESTLLASPAPPSVTQVVEASPVTQASQTGVGSGSSPAGPPTAPSLPHATLVTRGGVPGAEGEGAPRSPATAALLVPPAVTAHGVTWTAGAVNESVGGPVPRQAWSVRTITGELIHEEGDLKGPGRSRKPYDDFMAMFPMTQLALMVRLTFEKLEARGMRPSIAGELLKLIGVTVLATWY